MTWRGWATYAWGFVAGAVLASYVALSCGPTQAQSAEVAAAIHQASANHGVSEAWLLRVARCESRYQSWVTSRGGHRGLFQFADRTWASMSAQAGWAGASPYDPWAAAGRGLGIRQGHEPALELCVMSENGALDFERWRRITEMALEVTEQHLKADRAAQVALRDAIAAGELRVRVLRKALSLIPDDGAPALPELPRRGVHTGLGPGRAAGMYLLGVLQQTLDGELTPRRARLACQGWSEGTVQDGLECLLRDGLVERPERGVYRLTDAGRNAPPAPPGMLPLKEPKEEPVEVEA